MSRKNAYVFLLVIVLCTHNIVFAQPLPVKPDSLKVYKKIEDISKRGKFTEFIYGLIFRPIPTNSVATVPKVFKKKKKSKKVVAPNYQGKVIRRINISTSDPFGYSLNDTATIRQNFLYRAGNKIHIKTQRITIQNLLLIHKNDSYDSLLVKESERLIRSQKYIHEVVIKTVPVGKGVDSVDLFVNAIDIWSIIPEGSVSGSSFTGDLNDNNFLGLGHGFQGIYTLNPEGSYNAFASNYSIPNIRNTYISTRLHFESDKFRNSSKSVNIERPFFSSFAKWAGGVFVAQQSQQLLFQDSLAEPVTQGLRFNTQDYWGGHAYRLFKGNTEDARTTNLITSARFLHYNYIETPAEIYDSLHVFSDENFYLGGIGISTRKYIQDRYVFNYGVTEDVPIGRVYGLTFGYQIKNNINRPYLGARYSVGSYKKWGYLSYNFEYGTFFSSGVPEQGVFLAEINYFTGLFEIGRWKFRQFAKPQFVLGIDRFPGDVLSINNENGIRGFNSPLLQGTRKMVLTLQTQSYAPWNVLGFRFGPYLISSFGVLGQQRTGFANSEIYTQFAFGLLIKNEFLIFNIFQVSIAFYPVIPGLGNNIFKINPNETSDFGFRNFELGKPVVAPYK